MKKGVYTKKHIEKTELFENGSFEAKDYVLQECEHSGGTEKWSVSGCNRKELSEELTEFLLMKLQELKATKPAAGMAVNACSATELTTLPGCPALSADMSSNA